MSSGQSIVPHTSAGLAAVLLEAPITGWLDADVPVVQDATINFAITVFCGEAVMLVIDVSVPVPGIAKQLTAQVTAATRYSQVASVLSGGASSGSALGRVMATRSMVMCSADSAVGGGLVDLELSLCSDASSTSGPVAARSGIVSNIVLIAVVLAVLVALCVAWSALAGTSLVDASRVFCLPSSTLSMWTALLPSTAASATLLFGRIGDTACVAMDVALAVVGATVVIIPCVALGALWHVSCGGATGPRWVCTKASSGLRTPHSAMQRGLRRVWKWSNVGSHMLQPVWAVLLEYRILWYAVLDTTMLAAFAVLGVVSGLGTSTGVCHALTMVALLLMIVQLCVVLIVRPFTTLFSLVHTSVTLSLTCVGLLAQLLFMLTSPTTTDGIWLVDFAAGCNFAAVGVSAVKMTLDAGELLMALRRRGMRLQEQRRAQSRDALPPLAELLLLVDKSPTVAPAALVEGPGHLQQDIISAASETSSHDSNVDQRPADKKYWDDQGRARVSNETVEKEAILQTQVTAESSEDESL
ncbi:transmembrane protein, putative [Bodo saltans]|uniref:Transmembrane protein, putative n=1 Tax=Bodo saltans TaxID=75058 RepID=A0A0S4JFX2_BODSA|nr:transmembrane protein, putative [Bodo saltans]|eukprot:CUG90458.1 transmembrane protein, putative [Bodo saltans]